MKKRTTKLPGAVVKAADKMVSLGEYPYEDLHDYLQLVYAKYCRQINMLWPSGEEEPEDLKWKNNQVSYFYHVTNQLELVDTLMTYEGVHWELVKMLANSLTRTPRNKDTMIWLGIQCVFTCQNNPEELGQYPLNDLLLSLRINRGREVSDYFWPPVNYKLLHGNHIPIG